MSRFLRLVPLWLVLVLAAPAWAEEGDEGRGDLVTWSADLPTAFAEAKALRKVVLVCVNATHVRGRREEEPAAKELREVTYRDPRVVARSRTFVCVLLASAGNSADFGELRALGIDGDLVSPQHLFVHPDGTRLLLRRQYWSHAHGEPSVVALLGLMDQALSEFEGAASDPAAEPDDDEPPEAERAEWIGRRIARVVGNVGRKRHDALKALVLNDRDGDCTGPLIQLLVDDPDDPALRTALLRALGRDGLEAAALPVAAFLGHKDIAARANAAVSLEYIGSRSRKVLAALKRAVGREKDDAVANHMYRALGRCGVEDSKVRALLLKKAGGARSEFASYGPLIGLAWFEGDTKAARGVEKLLKQIGVPGSRRGGGQNTVKRGVLAWTLAAIGDPESAPFVAEELVAKLEHVREFWVDGLRAFYGAVVRKCQGDESEMAGIEEGVRAFVSFARQYDLGRYGAETGGLMDAYRRGRDNATFTPRGDHLLEARDGG